MFMTVFGFPSPHFDNHPQRVRQRQSGILHVIDP